MATEKTCRCDRPQVFPVDPGDLPTCSKCGKRAGEMLSNSSLVTATAIAEVVLGKRKSGSQKGRQPSGWDSDGDAEALLP